MRLLAVLFALGVSFPLAAQEKKAETLKDALAKGDPAISLRYRYEIVDEVPFEKNAYASTLRTTLSYRTLPFKGFSAFLEAQNVASIGEDLFDNRGAGDLANGVTDRPAVADPSQTRMQQVYLRLDALETAFDFGRREIIYGDHRFIGNVGWRQNHQTFDAINLSNRTFGRATISYAFADKVVQITGAEKEMSSHLLNGLVRLDPEVSLELYLYLLDYDALPDSGLSSQSYGGKLSGTKPIAQKYRLHFQAQYAWQSDFADNPVEVSADYLHLIGGVGFPGDVNVRVGRELLGGSPETGAFQTPLATVHLFNGWADKFTTTPADGVVDWYVSLDGKAGPLSWLVVYHDFAADTGQGSYGTEWDAQAIYPTSWRQSFGAKLALYREDGFSTDTSKIWFWTEYGF
ncbi:MAG TPA: alginate export family protein [Vicinamibacteria bacterium]|nr:alginate export family protein [Vicinamibacteria bacterium]